MPAPNACAFCLATVNASSERSMAITRQLGRASFKLTAMAPVPVPTSTTVKGVSGLAFKQRSTNSSVSGLGIKVCSLTIKECP